MDIAIKAVLVGLIIGGLLAIYVTRRSLREEKVYGALAKFFHFLGALYFCMTLPTVLAVLMLRGGFGIAFPLGISLVVTSLMMCFLFAIFEQPARPKITPEDDVWTEEKARASGM
jgi:hypothetical protein